MQAFLNILYVGHFLKMSAKFTPTNATVNLNLLTTNQKQSSAEQWSNNEGLPSCPQLNTQSIDGSFCYIASFWD